VDRRAGSVLLGCKRLSFAECKQELSERQQKLVELFFGVRIEELQEKEVSTSASEEKKCLPVEEDSEDDVSSCGEEEELSEEEGSEEEEQACQRVVGIDDAAMG